LQRELRSPHRDAAFRGTLIDSPMFKIDVEEWGFIDLERQHRQQRTGIRGSYGRPQPLCPEKPECAEEPAA